MDINIKNACTILITDIFRLEQLFSKICSVFLTTFVSNISYFHFQANKQQPKSVVLPENKGNIRKVSVTH